MCYTDITKAYKRACEEEGKTIDFLAFKKGYVAGIKSITFGYECNGVSDNFVSRNSCSSCDSFDRNNNWCTNFGRHTESGDICKWYRRTELKMN